MKIDRILVPTDFSENSSEALDYASRFPSDAGARLYIVHVDSLLDIKLPTFPPELAGSSYDAPWGHERHEIRERLTKVVPTIASVAYEHRYLTGSPLAAQKGQNRPEMYRDIVRLCREYGISSHFSNIIGFPQDTPQEIYEHLEALREMGPTWASFYILCPIPGTEQYDEFLADGLITEKNLDRFDTTCLTWNHPCFSREQLSALLFECYRKFISFRHALRNVQDEVTFGVHRLLARSAGSMAMSMFTRYCAWRRTHPMSGGIARILRDSVADYIAWRKETFGFELAPLPRSLQLPVTEIQPNRVVASVAAVSTAVDTVV